MPSATAAREFVQNPSGSVPHLLGSYLGRTAVVAAGMYAAGKRKHVLRDAAAGTAIIEAVILAYFYAKPRSNADLYTQQHVARFLQGDVKGLVPITEDVTIRAAEIALGMYLAGTRKDLVKDSIAGSLAVEALILGYSMMFGGPCPR